ncbi:MAG TPA: hypothetical protein VIC06_07450 [Solirubrobacteraceae bacterium]
MRTTPGRLRLAAVLLALGAIVFGVLAASAVSARRQAADSVATDTEPLLVTAEGLYASLSDADATAATTFLTGGLEPPARRERYASDVRAASGQLATLARQAGGSAQTRAAVRTLATQLSVYSGLVETARTNNRQGFPVGAAYLRQASTLMREELLPAAGRLYEVEARRLSGDYRSGGSAGTLLAVIAVVCAVLGLLAAIQVRFARLTHRIFNVPMALATVLVLALGAWMIVGLISEQNALGRAQRTGSDPVQVLSAARILALRAQGDEGLALVARGGGEASLTDLDAVTRRLGSSSEPTSLLGEAAAIARRGGSAAAIDSLSATFARYLAVHRRVVALETNGRFDDAVNLAVGSRSQELSLSDALNSDLVQEISAAQRRFGSAADDATSALGGLWLAIPLLSVLFAVLALYGLLQRLEEYR